MVYFQLEHVVGYRDLVPHTDPGPSANCLLNSLGVHRLRESRKAGISVMFKLHLVWPPAEFSVGFIVTVAWMSLLGYGVYKLSLTF